MTRRGRKILWMVTVVYAAGLVAGSLLPSGEGPLGGWDAALTPDLQDALHLPAYAGLVILLSAALAMHIRLTAVRAAWIALSCVGLGALLEFAQTFVPGRTCSLKDGLVNAAGALLGAVGSLIWQRCRGARPLVTDDSAAVGKETGLANR
jgi:hypothetical protein